MTDETAVERCDRKLRARGSSLHDVCGVDRSAPAHWARPASKRNGRGGSIPDKYHRIILKESARLKAGIKPTDLINA